MDNVDNLSLGDAVSQYMAGLPASEKEAAQIEINRFARWYGWNTLASKLSPPQVAQYAEKIETSVPDPSKKLEPVRNFLAYLKKEGINPTNLSVHLKPKKSSARMVSTRAAAKPRQEIAITAEGRKELEAKLKALKAQRPKIVEAVQLARADKDFRENAPLDAAREQHAHVESQIRELDETLKAAVVVHNGSSAEGSAKVTMGSIVTVYDLESGQEIRFTMVSPKEVSLSRGRVSMASPLGSALRGHLEGDTVAVKAPAGLIHYRIERIER